MRDVTDQEFQEVINNGRVLVDFYSTWCQLCKPVTALLEKIEVDYPDVTFIKVNIDEALGATTRCNIGAVPTLLLFENGEQVAQHLGGLSRVTLGDWLGV